MNNNQDFIRTGGTRSVKTFQIVGQTVDYRLGWQSTVEKEAY